jgi:hypothetical protein
VKGGPGGLGAAVGCARYCFAERELTLRTREERGRLLLLDGALVGPPVQRKHASQSLRRSIISEAEGGGLIDLNLFRVGKRRLGVSDARYRASWARRAQ